MSRRDTIIIAVLINAGLLIVLFASALKSNSSGQEMASSALEEPAKVSELPVKKVESNAAPAEEVDLVLRQYAAAQNSAAPSVAQSQPTLATSQETQNFAQDLQAIALPDTSAAAALPEQPDTEGSPRIIEVTVKKGDVLEKIARHNQTSVEEIMKLNNLATTRLKVGQVLKVSQGSKKKATAVASAPAKASTQTPAQNSPKYYTVKKGDNPWTIAVKNHIKVEELLKLNNLTQEKARHLKPGDQLRIK